MIPKLRRFLLCLTYLLPGVLFFSYHPILKLGQNSSMNFELSLPLIWLVIFDLVAFVTLIALGVRKPHKKPKNAKNTKNAKNAKTSLFAFDFPGISDRRFFFFALFPLYATFSIFWSANPTRALLTSVIIWLLFFAIFSLIYLLPLLKLPTNFRRNLLLSFFLSTTFVCIFCWIQCFLDIFGLERSHTLLCLGCTYLSFGFPHPSGFAIEPQFMGNLLLAPTLTALYLLVFSKAKSSRRSRFALIAFASFFSATLFITFSRGAIYAYLVALVVLLAFAICQHRHLVSLILIPIFTFIFSLSAQGIFSIIGPTDETFLSSTTKSLHHLSLGLLDFRSLATEPSPASATDSAPDSTATDQSDQESAIFEGYVVESTNVRLNLNSVAWQTWLHDCSSSTLDSSSSCPTISPLRILFGVGLGGAGTAMHTAFPEQVTSPKEIVQNQFFSLLLELGIVGILLFLLILILAFVPYSPHSLSDSFWHHPALPLLISLLVAYLVTLNFFSGLPNALQIYLIPPLLFLTLRKTLAKPLRS